MKSGFVSIIGRTNAGKSSFLNSLLNQQISIVSHKKNATRRKIKGVVMNKNDQIIFIDTPGLHSSEKTLNKLMINEAIKSINDCDLIIFIASIFDETNDYEQFLSINKNKNHILVLSKVDLAKNNEVLEKISQYQKYQDKFKSLLMFSTKHKTYHQILLDEICKFLPEHEYFYDPQYISVSNEKEIYRDFILQAMYENLSDEIPYLSDVIIKSVNEKNKIIEIYAEIITEKNSHKAIIIGKNANTIKRIGIRARNLINTLKENKIFLNLSVIIKKSWSKNENFIKKINNY